MNFSEQKLIVFRVGWMKHYQGMKGDTIQSSAQFVVSENYGYEMYNFLPHNGYQYGFVQPSGSGDFTQRTVRIERLGASQNVESIENVLVAWVAPQVRGGVYLIGWYKNATVYRKYQESPKNSDRIFRDVPVGYYARAKQKDCVLLSEEDRILRVPKSNRQMGGLGQSLVWYADSNKTNDRLFRQSLFEFIESYEHSTLEDILNKPQYLALLEGNSYEVTSTVYERNSKARRTCIDRYGAKCMACEFDFSEFYGSIGEGFIHVHHIKPLAAVGQEYEIDPIQDLQPVCPNCHAMIHKRNPPYTIEEIKIFIQRKRDA